MQNTHSNTDPLLGPRLKVSVAEQQLARLNTDIERIKEANKDFIVTSKNARSGQNEARIRFREQPHPATGVFVGQIAHNLRSSLDWLTWQLALLNVKEPASTIQFPIFRLKREFASGARRQTKSLRRDHVAVIEKLQPFKRGNGGRRDPLWILHELNRADKHRLIQVVTTTGIPVAIDAHVVPGDVPTSAFTPLKRPLKDGAKIPSIRRRQPGTGRYHEISVNVSYAVDVMFAGGCPAAKNLPVVPYLVLMVERVTAILELFQPVFESEAGPLFNPES